MQGCVCKCDKELSHDITADNAEYSLRLSLLSLIQTFRFDIIS